MVSLFLFTYLEKEAKILIRTIRNLEGILKSKILHIFVLVIIAALILAGCTPSQNNQNNENNIQEINDVEESTENNEDLPVEGKDIHEEGLYTSPEDVAMYIHLYNKLPLNFITKKEAIELGWDSEEGNLWEVTEQMSIGGDVFGNREGKLPKKDGRKWYECDVNYHGGYRGAERIVFSNDGLIYYTDDHYETFTKIY